MISILVFKINFTIESELGMIGFRIDMSISAVRYKVISHGEAKDCWQYFKPPKK